MHNLTVINDIVDMNRLTLKFRDPKMESKYQKYSAEAKHMHMKIGTYAFTVFLVGAQTTYKANSMSSLETGLPTTTSIWWFVLLMAIACLVISMYPFLEKRFKEVGRWLNYFYYCIGIGFIVYIGVLTEEAVDNMSVSKDQVLEYLGNKTHGLSTDRLVDTYNLAASTSNLEELKSVAAVTTWFTLSNTCAFIHVVVICVLDAITMTTFIGSTLTCSTALIVNFSIFGLSVGPTNGFLVIILLIHIWTIRFTEINNRHEFVVAEQQMQKIVEEEEKIKRKNEALEAKLKLTVDQLKLIEQAEDEIVGDKIAELGAWKVDVDTEVVFDKKIAAGAFGIVYLAKMRATGRNVAVKQLLSDQVNQENMERFFSEILLHSKLHHPHLVEMIAASWEPPNLCLVLAYCQGGDLKGLLENKYESLRWTSHKLRFCKEISQAIGYLHSHHILHRDLKTANILVDTGLKMRVSDFGESRVIKHSDHNLTVVGTNFYIAPEVFRGDSHYDFKADVFGFGMIMLAMAVKDGNLRNFFVDQMGMKVKISANHASMRLNDGWRPDLLGHNGRITGKLDLSSDEKMKPALADLIKTLISPDPKERPTMNDVVKAVDNLDRWVCITPPTWSQQYDSRIVLQAEVCHPERGLGTVVSFDGFDRVHVLYNTGNDMYRRYSEEGWVSKMSIGKVVDNPKVLDAKRSPLTSSKGLGGRNKNRKVVPGEQHSMSRSVREKDAYAYGNDQSMGLSDISASMSFGPIKAAVTNPNLTTIGEHPGEGSPSINDDSFAEEKTGSLSASGKPINPSFSRERMTSFQGPNPEAEEDMKGFLQNSAEHSPMGPAASHPIKLTEDQMTKKLAPTHLPATRKKRRRSSLVALSEDKNFDPSAAIAGALKNAQALGLDVKAGAGGIMPKGPNK
ncbi:hypothetical protein TL16_g01187 [Triparma laevis f. inornata]|uniref:Protein kinase domain-containing protein n=1 Tax=Triparma laevis f. inornata TaxID=1714386 RepID=A0A9W7DRN7_9STRA|nr:hypothetical protein TL16_g01187 [Triparma laevis f. inornata]